MAYTETWDETKPAGSRDANLGDDDIREFKRAIRERLADGGMYFPTTDDADAGSFQYTKFIEQSSNPTAEANRGYLFTKEASSVTELYYMDSAGTVIQLTTGGKLPIASLYIASEAEGDIIYRGASAWERLAKGSASQQLRINAGATAPEWFTPTAATTPASDQAVGTTSITRSTDSFADMTDMSVTLTTEGGNVLISFCASITISATNGTAIFQIDIDGSAESFAICKGGDNHNEHGGGTYMVSFSYLKTSLAAGSHTFKIQWKGNGSATVTQDGTTYPRIMNAVEIV
jgi:hypothetical protein